MIRAKKLKILIIENDPTSAFLLRHYLFDLFFKDIHIFSDAESGMEAIRIIKPDVIFLNISSKDDYSGFDVLKFVEASKMHIHVIVTTTNLKFVNDVVLQSIMDFLIKPLSRENLRLAFEKVEQHNILHNQLKNANKQVKGSRSVEINSNKEICPYDQPNVVRIEADGNYPHFF